MVTPEGDTALSLIAMHKRTHTPQGGGTGQREPLLPIKPHFHPKSDCGNRGMRENPVLFKAPNELNRPNSTI